MTTTSTNRWTPGLMVASLVVLTAACGQAMAPADDVAPEVTTAWAEAFNAGDAAALAALYADDARTMPPGGPAIVGRADIESYWRADLGEGGATTTLTTTDTAAVGDAVHVEGTYAVEGDDGIALAQGQFVQLWTPTDEGWQVQHEMWRSDPALQRTSDLADRLTSSWTAAYNAGDVQALVDHYSENATISTIQEGSFMGLQSIEAFWKGDLMGGEPESTLSLTDAYIAGELAHLEGTYAVSMGEALTEGRYVQLWMREGNDWKIHREMWLR